MKNIYNIIKPIIIALFILLIVSCSKSTKTYKNDYQNLIDTNSHLSEKVNDLESRITRLQNDISQKEKENNDLKNSLAKEKAKQLNEANTNQVIPPDNDPIISLSPDKKFIAEAYGTNTRITAGGVYPYKVIQILSVDDNDIIWTNDIGGYTVGFSWSPDSQYVGVSYTGRIWEESVIIDLINKKTIPLPSLDEIASFYGETATPCDYRPDPYFKICKWEDAETVIVDFHWHTSDDKEFKGEYTFNIKINKATYSLCI